MNTSVHIDGDRIRCLREEKDLTQLYLATVVGVTTDTISRWENRRYPSIKLENAQKVAEALEVSLADILQEQSLESNAPEEKKSLLFMEENDADIAEDTRPWSSWLPSLRHPVFWVVFLVLMVMAAVFLWIMDNRSTPIIQAVRLVPGHAAPGSPFPVIVRLTVEGDVPVSVLVREQLACDCEAGDAGRKFGKNPRWIGATSGGDAFFFYLVRPSKSKAAGQILFSGEAAIRSREKAVARITGPDRIELLPYHWADSDRDYRISDDEILQAFETFSLAAGTNGFLDEVEQMWLAGRYVWNEKTNNIIIPVEGTAEIRGSAL